ncbi:MAG: cyclic nucleotide-binding domain-containing protein [Chloroflexota bacterium]
MISTELIRRYPFFAGLTKDQIATLAKVANEVHVERGHSFFREGDELNTFYMVVEGSVNITIGIPDQFKRHSLVDQITNNLDMVDTTVSNVTEGNVFGWSALIPPYRSSASAVASKPCQVIAFNCEQLRPILERDCEFALRMTIKAAQIIRSRLHDMRIESLAFVS